MDDAALVGMLYGIADFGHHFQPLPGGQVVRPGVSG
jgi:hypothetical protein